MQKPDSTCRQGREMNPRPAELASQPGSLHCSSESLSPLSHVGRSTAAILKIEKLRYLQNRFDRFDEILHDRSPERTSYSKIQILKNLRWPPFKKTLKAITPQLFERFWWNLVWRCILTLPTCDRTYRCRYTTLWDVSNAIIFLQFGENLVNWVW